MADAIDVALEQNAALREALDRAIVRFTGLLDEANAEIRQLRQRIATLTTERDTLRAQVVRRAG